MRADFSGYATKNDLRCSDGRTIKAGAFKHHDKKTVPLVWQHQHNDPNNVLGHAVLENRADGVYAYGFFNDTEQGQNAKKLVVHRDINALSIFANNLAQRGSDVYHGDIKEVSLVLSGANPGAVIDNVFIQHGDSFETLEQEAVIYTGLTLEHQDAFEVSKEGEEVSELSHDDIQSAFNSMTEEQQKAVHFVLGEALNSSELNHANGGTMAEADEKTVQDVFDSMTEEQKNVVYYMIAQAAESGDNGEAEHSDIDLSKLSDEIVENVIKHFKEDPSMTRNVFEQNGAPVGVDTDRPTLSHSDLETIVTNAQKLGSFKDAFLEHAATYGITDIDYLFPDAKAVTSQPELIARRTEWVKSIIDGAKHSPFARIKSLAADLTAEEARAKGYVKGNLKKDEIIKLLKRVTTPTTIYKKQKLDRDDIVDITDLDVVAWLKWEMRFMLEEELARAILIGDGREPDDDDKIDEEKLRPIAWDNDMYSHPVTVPTNTTPDGIVESVLRARKHYKGTGTPSFYTTDDILTDMLLIKDKMGRRVYNTEAELAAALRVKEMVVVEVMEDTPDLLGIIVNIADYTIGADKGGSLSMFDDFDIDYNQHKYLIETRISGALTKPKSAVVIKRTTGTTVTPQVPAFDAETNTITVPNQTGVAYFNVTDPLNEVALTDGASVVITETTDVEARPETGYNFPHNTDNDWTFAYTA